MTNSLKFYTATGDDGTTGLLGKGRVKKYHARPEAYGTVDEAQAALGIARAAMRDTQAAMIILQVQRDLYDLMAELAATRDAAAQFRVIGGEQVQWLEQQTDRFGEALTLPAEFTVSGETLSGAYLDLARSITRRAERIVVRLFDDGHIENRDLIRYLNRLSSLLFVLSRLEDTRDGEGAATLAKTTARKRQPRTAGSTGKRKASR